MGHRWIQQECAAWNDELEAIVGGAPDGVFPVAQWREASVLPGSWWTVQDEAGRTIAVATLDTVWGDAEVMVAVHPGARRAGAGAFAMAMLRTEAQARGLAYMRNQVPAAHPAPGEVAAWLEACGFSAASGEGEYHCRVRVRSAA